MPVSLQPVMEGSKNRVLGQGQVLHPYAWACALGQGGGNLHAPAPSHTSSPG